MDTLDTLTKEQLIALVKEQAEAPKAAQQAIAALQEEIARLKSGGSGNKPERELPAFVKAQLKPAPSKLRKKRAQNFTQHRLPPTEQVVHACETCPDCHGPLRGGWERSRRQGIDLPPIVPRITDHITLSRHCGRCGKTVTPRPDLSDCATGQQTFGHGVVSLCAYVKTAGRVPTRTICRLLCALLGISVSAGQATEMLHTVARQGKETYDGLQNALRAAPFVHADETSWRENGQSGYVWSFSTPTLRYFRYRKINSAYTPPPCRRLF